MDLAEQLRKAKEAAAAIAKNLGKTTKGKESAEAAKSDISASPTASVEASSSKRARMQYKSLLLDDQGREIDEDGNLVVQEKRPRARVGGIGEAKKASVAAKRSNTPTNPYLAHMGPDAGAKRAMLEKNGLLLDDRLALPRTAPKAISAGFNFVEPGTYVQAQEEDNKKEEGRVKSGRRSGRKAPTLLDGGAVTMSASAAAAGGSPEGGFARVPDRPVKHLACPEVEWWDAVFLPKQLRIELKEKEATYQSSGARYGAFCESGRSSGTNGKGGLSKYSMQQSDYSSICYQHLANMSPKHCKTLELVQHCPPIASLADEGSGDVQFPMYLTQKERKKVRRQEREAKEQTKRDLQMMGLAPAPEPKFKMSNFMKILGDTAVANPSAVEQKVLEKVKQRQLAHEVRNLSQKLTPKERTEKRLRKYAKESGSVTQAETGGSAGERDASEATPGGARIREPCHVAVFRVGSLASNKHRYQLDVSASQLCLSGVVMQPTAPPALPLHGDTSLSELHPSKEVGSSLVVVEGGAKGVSKFVRLVTVRMDWSILPQAPKEDDREDAPSAHDDAHAEVKAKGPGQEGEGMTDMDAGNDQALPAAGGAQKCPVVPRWRGAELLWQGKANHHAFTNFRFQEFTSTESAHRSLATKGLQQYWDLLSQADCRAM